MQLQQRLVWTAAGLAMTLVLTGSWSSSEAQNNRAKSSAAQDGRYWVYVKGIT